MQRVNAVSSWLGLSDHATVHHGCWYSTWNDHFVAVPEVDFEAKRLLVREGQAHPCYRVDPAEVGRAVAAASIRSWYTRKRPQRGVAGNVPERASQQQLWN